MPYFSILSIVYRFFVVIEIRLLLHISTVGNAVAVMVAFKLIEALVHFMLCDASCIIRYAQRATSIDEALAQHPQHRVVDDTHRLQKEGYGGQHTPENEHRHGTTDRDVVFALPCHDLTPFRNAGE